MHKPATSMAVLVLDVHVLGVWSLTIWHREHDGCTAGGSEEPSHQHKEPGSEGKIATVSLMGYSLKILSCLCYLCAISCTLRWPEKQVLGYSLMLKHP